MTAQASLRLTPEIVFMVAVAQNNAIGQGNKMPWHLKSDLQRFKTMTLNKPVVMGRKTFQSIGRPLPGRTNIVITRDQDFRAAGVVIAPSLNAAYDVALGDALRRCAAEIVVIGGAEIFAQWMARADRLEITEVHAAPEADTFLEPIDLKEWQEVARQSCAKTDNDTADFSYVTYKRHT